MSRHISLSHHLYVNIDNTFLGPSMPCGVTKGIWHGIYCKPDQTLLTHILLESGAHWSGIPIHAISTTNNFTYDYKQLMPWSGMGENIETVFFKYLEGLSAEVLYPIKSTGRHTGIMIDWSDGYSKYPQEHKPLNLIELSNGQFALLPNNYVIYQDKHFTSISAKENMKHYLRGDEIYWGE